MMTKSAALDVVKDNIRINSIHPGQIDTPIVANLTPEMDRAIKARIPMGRLGRPEEIANVSLFLCSDMSSYITGEEISVDGGWNAN
jgi:NAD(P)-dependent dehydrogenase (short-subunit alcohol dehydrogenase family)